MWRPLSIASYALLVPRTEAYGGSSQVSNAGGDNTVAVAVTVSIGLVLLLVVGYWLYHNGCARSPGQIQERGYLCCCLVKKPKFQVGDWVSVVRDGNQLRRKTLGQVTEVGSKTFGSAEGSTRTFFYSIKFPSSSPAADQREEWLTPAAAPTEDVHLASP